MVRTTPDASASPEPVPCPEAEHPSAPGKVRRVGRVRLPLGLHHAPWATLYRLPDGRLAWIVHLWEVDGPVRRWVPTSTIRRFCVINRFPAILREVDRLEALGVRRDAPR
jgi:hypothetical protein